MTKGTAQASLGGAAAMARAQASRGTLQSLASNSRVFGIALFASFGGLLYGYQQGVLGQALVMHRFGEDFPDIVASSGKQGWLTSILQLGGWAGALSAGVLCEIFTRKHTIFMGAMWAILGSFLTAGARNSGFLYAGRFFTGIGVGTLSGTGPLYNAELAPPEIRGVLVSMQQLATTIGIMVAYWIAYGSAYIGGTGEGQSSMAWRLPLIVQGIPAVILAIGVWFLPFSPRLFVNKGREEEARQTLSKLRRLPADDPLVNIELLEIKSESEFEKRSFEIRFPELAQKTRGRPLVREVAQYYNIFGIKDCFKRVALGSLIMFMQQWSGIDSIIYYAPIIFRSLGLDGRTISLLATGVVGVVNVITTVPAMLLLDKVGRKPLLICGSAGMFLCQLIIEIIVAKCSHDWESYRAAGWGAVVMVWLYIVNFAYSWGPVSWVMIAEIFPLSIRAKGTTISASSNWMNNFIIAFITPPLLSDIEWGTYIFFSVWCVVGGLFVYFFLPETKGKTLEEMDIVFGAQTSQEDIALLAAVQEEVGLTRALASIGLDSAETTKPDVVHV
ncbi:hypothetical protein NW754_002322 [Fusarium falciforme]|nr:hypothetical protein NW754_002322 [Fusarium falciforme]